MTKTNKRELILNALENLLPGRRFHEITMDEVARSAQVGKGTIYLYFSDKDSLFAELVIFQLAKLCEELSQLHKVESKQLPEQVFELISKFISRQQNWFGAIGEAASQVARLAPEHYDNIHAQGRKVVETLTGVMQGFQPGWDESMARHNARILLWMIDGYCRSLMSDPQPPLPEPAFLTEFFRRGCAGNKNN